MFLVTRSLPRPRPAVGGSPHSRVAQKFLSLNMSSSWPATLVLLGLFLEKLLLPRKVIQLSVKNAYFFLHDEQLKAVSQTLSRAVPRDRRPHYLRVIGDGCGMDVCCIQELPHSLSRSLSVVQGGGHLAALVTQVSTRIFQVSSVSKALVSGSFTFRAFSSSSTT